MGERTDVEDRLRGADMLGEAGFRLATVDMRDLEIVACERGRV